MSEWVKRTQKHVKLGEVYDVQSGVGSDQLFRYIVRLTE